MSDELNKDVQTPEPTGTAPSTDNKATDPQPAPAPEDQKVPLHRLNEESEKRKAAEREAELTKQQLAALQQQVAQLAGNKSDMTRSDYNDSVETLATRFGVDKDFLKELVKVTGEVNKKQIEPALALASQEAGFERELDALMEEVPETEDLTRAEVRQLKKMAFSTDYAKTPLKAVYTLWKAGKKSTTTDKQTLEPARPTGTTPSSDPDISKMSVEEFKKYSNSLGSKKRRG